MKINNFVVSECGNDAEDAWGRAQGIASLENQAEPQSNVGILHKKGFTMIGKVKDGATTLEALRSAKTILEQHRDATIENENALCLDANDGEYFFIGKAKIDK